MLCIKQSTLYNILCIIAKLSLQSCLFQTKLGSNLVTLECRKGGRRGGGTLSVLRSTVQISADLAWTDLLSKHTRAHSISISIALATIEYDYQPGNSQGGNIVR